MSTEIFAKKFLSIQQNLFHLFDATDLAATAALTTRRRRHFGSLSRLLENSFGVDEPFKCALPGNETRIFNAVLFYLDSKSCSNESYLLLPLSVKWTQVSYVVRELNVLHRRFWIRFPKIHSTEKSTHPSTVTDTEVTERDLKLLLTGSAAEWDFWSICPAGCLKSSVSLSPGWNIMNEGQI